MTTVVSKPLSFVENLFFEIVVTPELNAGLAALFVAVPVLAIWPLSAVVDALANFLVQKAYAQLVLTIDIGAIQFIDRHQQDAWDSASIQLYSLAEAGQGPGTPAYEEAKSNAKNALSQFVHFGPSLLRLRANSKYYGVCSRWADRGWWDLRPDRNYRDLGSLDKPAR